MFYIRANNGFKNTYCKSVVPVLKRSVGTNKKTKILSFFYA
jgi:hypothetical protein